MNLLSKQHAARAWACKYGALDIREIRARVKEGARMNLRSSYTCGVCGLYSRWGMVKTTVVFRDPVNLSKMRVANPIDDKSETTREMHTSMCPVCFNLIAGPAHWMPYVLDLSIPVHVDVDIDDGRCTYTYSITRR